MSGAPAGFGLYVHWPFCLSKCPYCDFNSRTGPPADIGEWRRAFARALDWFAARTPGRRLASVFFGGGTPSLMPPALVGAVLERAARLWSLAPDAEITLEANPTSAETERFREFAAAGVTRLSLGVQALNDRDLRKLGRTHTLAEALAAWERAQRLFPRASFDLIYARPGQTPREWERELARALSLGPRHLSAYQLSLGPGTPFFARHARGELTLPGEETAAELFVLTEEMTAAAGLAAYEISNFAVPGEECRHNLLYWRYGEYAGVGPGAHSRLRAPGGERRALTAFSSVSRWLAAASAGGVEEEVPLTPAQAATEYLLMSLRTREGLDLSRHAAEGGGALPREPLEEMLEQGLLHAPAPGRLAATQAGRLVLDRIIAALA